MLESALSGLDRRWIVENRGYENAVDGWKIGHKIFYREDKPKDLTQTQK